MPYGNKTQDDANKAASWRNNTDSVQRDTISDRTNPDAEVPTFDQSDEQDDDQDWEDAFEARHLPE